MHGSDACQVVRRRSRADQPTTDPRSALKRIFSPRMMCNVRLPRFRIVSYGDPLRDSQRLPPLTVVDTASGQGVPAPTVLERLRTRAPVHGKRPRDEARYGNRPGQRRHAHHD